MAANSSLIALRSPFIPVDPRLIPAQWAQCKSEMVQTVESKVFERFMPTRAGAIQATMYKHVSTLVQALYQSGGVTQTQGFGNAPDDPNKFVIKVRLSETGIETLVYKTLGLGTNKIVNGVVRCTGGPIAAQERERIYAYAKCSDLSGYRRDLFTAVSAQLKGALTPELQGKMALAQSEIPKIEALLRSEVEMASLVPTAVHTWPIGRRHNLAQIKGIGMEYIEGGDLFAFLNQRSVPSPCSHDLVLLASRVCFAVSQAHQRGILHGDVKSPNILLKKTHEGSVIPLLCDFGAARRLPSKEACIERESTYAAPETLRASAERPVEYSLSMDCFSLGLTILDTVYGVRVTKKLFDSASGVSRSWEGVAAALRDEPVNLPDVNVVIQNLMQDDPAARWTAMQAWEALRIVAERVR